MTDVVISIAAKAAEYMVKPTIQQGQYLFCANTIIQNLAEEKEQLSQKIKEIQKHIQEEKKKTKLTEESVEKWVVEAKHVLQVAENLKQEMEANKSCFQGWCPPWRRYHMSKQMVKKTKEMRNQISKIKIKPISRLMSLSKIDYDYSESFTYFQSTKEAYQEILEALRDGNIEIIGLYGMGGSGKTALANEVKKRVIELQLFDKVIFVTMSQTPNIKTIQEEMAKKLDLKFNEENEEDRGKRLWLSLKEHNRVLVIVDDVWKEFNLKHLGIAFDKTHESSCKVLLTMRNQDVCSSMDCQKKIMQHLLSEEEAWSLFQRCAGINDQSSPMVLALAHEVSKKCKGLPIAIKVIGSSLKRIQREFQVDHLKVALNTLKGSKPKKGDEEVVFKCLRFSYDYLKREEAKHLLCLCAVFPEDHRIPIEDLIRYGVGLGVCEKSESFDSARSHIRVGLSELLDSCLLVYTSQQKKHVKMHDLVREMALSISQEKDQIIKVNHEKDLHSLVGNEVIKQCFAVSSWYGGTNQLSHQLNAPKLEILLVNTMSSLDLSYVSFEFMKRLKIMAITSIESIRTRSISLPQSIQSLTNLKTLELRFWQLDDISFILSLEGLEALDLQGCAFNEVPDDIEKLHNLKLLDLRYTDVKNYNSKAIGRCSKLEELYVSGRMTCPPQCFLRDVNAISLCRYELILGASLHSLYLSYEDSIMKVLGLQGFDVLTIDGSKTNLLQKAEYACFNGLCGGSKNIVPQMDQAVGSMNELKMLHLVSCSEIECLFDVTSYHACFLQGDDLLPCWLITLSLKRMENLIEVCRGEPPLGFFKKLEELHISTCQQLHSIFPQKCNLDNLKILNAEGCAAVVFFSMSVAKNMQQLEKLTIGRCPELRHVITSDAEDGANTGEDISLAPKNSHSLFPSLKELRIFECPVLQVIFPISYVQENDIQIILPCLQVFELSDLENLLRIFPQKYTSRWPSVRSLRWKNCPKLTTPWIGLECGQEEVVLDEDHQMPMTSKLHELTLKGLLELHLMWFGPIATQILSFQFLQDFVIDGFKEMKFIFSMAVLRSLSELTSLSIINCDELVEIIAENEESKNSTSVELFFPKLRWLKIDRCNKLKSLFSIEMIKKLPQLGILNVYEASQLENIFKNGSEADIVNEVETVIPNLREIGLKKLPSFVNIYQGCMIHKLKLQDIFIAECPKFTPILSTTQAIPLHDRLKEKLIVMPVALTMNQLCRQQMCPIALSAFLSIKCFDLRNSGVEGVLQLQLVEEGQGGLQQSNNVAQKHFNSNLERLSLIELPELRFIWRGPTQFLEFYKLKFIIVDVCPKLKTVFPAGIAESLQNLVELIICNCRELEEISDLQAECFPKLRYVRVEKCNKLKCIFYAGCMASRHYASMRRLYAKDCSQLESIYGLKCTAEADNENHGEEEVLLELKTLELESLPNFTEIGPGIKLKEKPRIYYKVAECPKYIQQFEVVPVSPSSIGVQC